MRGAGPQLPAQPHRSRSGTEFLHLTLIAFMKEAFLFPQAAEEETEARPGSEIQQGPHFKSWAGRAGPALLACVPSETPCSVLFVLGILVPIIPPAQGSAGTSKPPNSGARRELPAPRSMKCASVCNPVCPRPWSNSPLSLTHTLGQFLGCTGAPEASISRKSSALLETRPPGV